MPDDSEKILQGAGITLRTIPPAEWATLKELSPDLYDTLGGLIRQELGGRIYPLKGRQIAEMIFVAASPAEALHRFLDQPEGRFTAEATGFTGERLAGYLAPEHLAFVARRVFCCSFVQGFNEAPAGALDCDPDLQRVFARAKKHLFR